MSLVVFKMSLPWVNAHSSPAPDYHNPGPFLHHLEVVSQVDVGQVFNDHIKSGSEMLHHLLLVMFVIMIEDMVRPALGHHLHPLLGPGSAHHHGPQGPGYLHRSCAHSSTGAMYQHSFSRSGLRSQNKCLVRSEEGHPEGGSLGERESWVKREHVGAV